ncbi:MAG: prenyltransferase/squalene oxidase repeat-containing protein [Dehalococcoidales bacterium]
MSRRKLSLTLSSLILSISLTVTSCSTNYPLKGTDETISKALEYLAEAQASDGSIGSYSDTGWAVMALSAAGKDPAHFGSSSPVEFLRQNNHQLLDSYNITADLARNVLAIISAGQSPFSFGEGNAAVPDGDYIDALTKLHDGQQFGQPDSINEDFWAINALIAAGFSPEDEIISTTVEYILENRGPDKGWSWATPYNEWYMESDPDNTAAAVMALVNAGLNPDDEPVAGALEAIKGMQGDNGGFVSYGVENSSSTSWAISAFAMAGKDPFALGNDNADALSYLHGMQDEDGHFRFAHPLPEGFLAMPEKTTAESIVALMGCGYPVSSPSSGNLWLWPILIMLVLSMIAFLYTNNRRRSK